MLSLKPSRDRPRLWLGFAAMVAATNAVETSCGGESTSGPAPSHVVYGTVSATIGPAGGTLTHPAGASVTIPQGALATTITVTIQGIDPPSASALEGAPISQGFILGPEGQTFAKPVTVMLPFDPTVVSGVDSRELLIESAVTGTASFLEQHTDVDVTANTLTARTMHFSTYGAARAVGAPLIATPTPILGTIGVPLSTHLQVDQTPPKGPYTWGLALGSPLLPQGSVLAPDGTLDVTALAAADTFFTIEVRDSANPQHVMQEPLELVILEAPQDAGVSNVDAGEDSGVGGGELDAGFDSGEDSAAGDAGFDGGADAEIDGASFDSGLDAGLDSGSDAGADSGQSDASDGGVCGNPGLTQCGSSCVDTTSDPQNCGGCGSICPNSQGVTTCSNSHCGYSCPGNTCASTCPTGYADTDGNPADGCETSVDCVMYVAQDVLPCNSTFTASYENVDVFSFVSFNGDPQGAMTTNSLLIAEVNNEVGNPDYPYFLANPSHTTYSGLQDGNENDGVAQVSGLTMAFTLDFRRCYGGGPTCGCADHHVICSGSTTLP